MGAALIDITVLAISEVAASVLGYGLAGGAAAARTGGSPETSPVMTIVGAAWFVFLFLYFPLMWRWKGATLGQSTVGLRVVRGFDGGPVGIGTAIVRAVGFWESVVSCVLVFGLVLIPATVRGDPRRRMWQDRMADTVVIKRAY